MFTGDVLWRGFVYTILMLLGKLITGVWLIRLNIPKLNITIPKAVQKLATLSNACLPWKLSSKNKPSDVSRAPPTNPTAITTTTSPTPSPKIQKPLSLYPASMLGCAMTARGEIGFLISSLAATNGIFDTQTYLVVTWAILLCTIIGPLAVGTLVRRVKRLEGTGERRIDGPLGIWGVS